MRLHGFGEGDHSGYKYIDIFFREVQCAWPELYPFADSRILVTARQLGLPGDVRRLARLASGDDFVRAVDALVRVRLDRTADEIRDVVAEQRSDR